MRQILHILSASLSHAQNILAAALGAGFRESGAMSLSAPKTGETNPMVAIRSTGYSFDSIIGFHDENGRNIALVDENYLQIVVRIANDRFKINTERIKRFRSALLAAYQNDAPGVVGVSRPNWEDAELRKRRKRAEGLARKEALQAQLPEATEHESPLADPDALSDVFP